MAVERAGETGAGAGTTTLHPGAPATPGSDRTIRAGLVPALTLLFHPRLERVGERAVLGDLRLLDAVGISRTAPGFAVPGAAGGAPLGDTHLSRKPLRVVALPDGQIRLDPTSSGTHVTADGEPLRTSRDFSPDEVANGVVVELAGRVVLLLHLVHPSSPEPGERFALVGDNHLVEQVRRDVRRIADLDVPVLVRGETGTGKELVARAIHQAGRLRDRPFVAVNMAAIPPSLAAAELFGAERGAYTGAVQSRPGYFGLAQDGTLFLDEVGEAPPDVQGMLLRVLETGEVQPVGARQAAHARVRLITATDADLEARVADGTFRAPLLHRLSGYEITLPPLRERRDDIARLILHFLRRELEIAGEAHRLDAPPASTAPWLPASLVARLSRHDWPGNVRQLRNVVRHLVIGSRGAASLEPGPALERMLRPSPPETRGRLDAGGSAPERRATSPGTEPPPGAEKDVQPASSPRGKGWRKPSEVREDELVDALRRSRWDLKAAAELLGVSRTSLYALVEGCPRVRRAGTLELDEIARCHRECGGDVDRMVDRLEVSKRALLRRIRELRLE
jgi:two-component system, NtrC family, nitrogen regulation response regulator GlnG